MMLLFSVKVKFFICFIRFFCFETQLLAFFGLKSLLIFSFLFWLGLVFFAYEFFLGKRRGSTSIAHNNNSSNIIFSITKHILNDQKVNFEATSDKKCRDKYLNEAQSNSVCSDESQVVSVNSKTLVPNFFMKIVLLRLNQIRKIPI